MKGKSRKGTVIGTSIHKEKHGDSSPTKFLGGLASKVAGKEGGMLGAVMNPMGALMDKTGMADTTLGKVLNPMSLLGKK
tara:strand:- start:51 stop:287 length:237 start_codon:yes stop_codon:yes gene_type:complete